MRLYIVARPYEDIGEFMPMYITTYEDKAQYFLKLYSDESIGMVIFSKEWKPDSPDDFPNILFNYFDELTDTQYDEMVKNNTLYGKYNEWLDLDEETSDLYMNGDPNAGFDKNGMMNVKIWNIDN